MYLIFDTETDGLNIRTSKPFIVPYAVVDKNLNIVKIKIAHTNNDIEMQEFLQHLKDIPTIVGHNIKFDLHMILNHGVDFNLIKDKNYIDTGVLARLVVDHDVQTDKTFQMSLKKLAVRYLGVDSANEERQLKMELSQLVMEHKVKMQQYFESYNLWPKYNKTENTKRINEVYNNWNKVFHLYPQLADKRRKFLKVYPEPTYADVSNVETYALTDVKLTYGLFKLWYPEVVRKQQVPAFKRTSEAVIPLLLMERQGFTVDVPRLMRDRKAILREWAKVKIIDPRTGEELSIGQHAKLKELYEYESGMQLTSANKDTRKSIEEKSPAARAANYIAKMEKYLSTYITGILNKLTEIDGEYKVFTQYNLAGTVTGRLSSDFQQFPRDPLELRDGSLIDIRGWFIVPKDYKYMFFLDYSQMELRLQCEWTNIIQGEPDLNLARAFSPYQCSLINGTYYLNENLNEAWKPTDLHALTAKHAFPNIDESHPDWDHYRSLGKRTNFAVNYGASPAAVASALSVPFKTAEDLVNGYRKAFPGAVAFAKWIRKRVWSIDNIPNLMFRRYYTRNSHQLLNWLVQGSGADILLEKMRKVYDYIQDKPHWQFMISVHDEVGYVVKDIPQEQLAQEVKEIQKLMTHSMTVVDIITDIEYSTTSWSDKKEWKDAL